MEYKLNSYGRTDEDRGDYMVYEIEYTDGHKKYVSRNVFKVLETLEIFKKILKEATCNTFFYIQDCSVKFIFLANGYHAATYCYMCKNQEEYNQLKEVLL